MGGGTGSTGVGDVAASSRNRQNAFASRIWPAFRARTRQRSGDPTTNATQRAREVATLSRLRLYRKSMPRGASSGLDVVSE